MLYSDKTTKKLQHKLLALSGEDFMRDFRAVMVCARAGSANRRSMAFRCGASLIAMCGLTAVPAFAQTSDQTQTPPPASGTQTGTTPAGSTDIIVTGIRASLANSQEIKRNSDTVVDAI